MDNKDILSFEDWKEQYPITIDFNVIPDLEDYHGINGEEEVENLRKIMYYNYVKLMLSRGVV